MLLQERSPEELCRGHARNASPKASGVCFLQTVTQPGPPWWAQSPALYVCPADVLPQARKYPPSFPRLER